MRTVTAKHRNYLNPNDKWSELQVPLGTRLKDFAIKNGADKPPVIAAYVNNMLKDLNYPLFCDSQIEWLDYSHSLGNKIFKQGLSMLLYVACQELWPNRRLKVMHSLRNGRYCELLGGEALNYNDYERLEQKMRELVAADLPIKKSYLTKKDAISFFKADGDQLMAANLQKLPEKKLPVYSLAGHTKYLFSKMVPSTAYLDNFAIVPFDQGFVICEPQNYNTAPCVDGCSSFNFPRGLQAALKAYDDWGLKLGVQYAQDLNQAVAADDFKNLVIMSESLQQRSLQKIADELAAAHPGVRLALIAGPSSSGKTSFCNRLAVELRSLGLKPLTLSLDNYFKNREDTPLNAQGKPDYEGLAAIDLPYFNQQLTELLAGQKVEMPIFDFVSGRRLEKTLPVQLGPADILLIEGIHGINDELTAAVPPENKRKIYVSCLTQLNIDDLTPIATADNRELRRLLRDVQFRGIAVEKTLADWVLVRAGEEQNIFPFQERADYFFNSALLYEWSVLRPLLYDKLAAVAEDSPVYAEARRLLKLISFFDPAPSDLVPAYSLLQEFLGGSCFEL
jgi:uridine kinase